MLCVVLGAAGAMAVTSSCMDVLADDAAGNPADSIEVGTMRSIAGGRLTMPRPAFPSFPPFVPRSTSKNGESDGL